MTESLPVGTVVAGRLRVERLLGAGGMGAVYEVEHLITKHRRALKLLHEEVTRIPGVVERFLREASAAGQIGNAHVVETFDAGTTERGEPYIVMELLKGRALSDLLAERGLLELPEVVDLVGQACEGVQAAHDAGIIHRDLKPENLFIVDAERPFVKLVDFGISKFDPARTGTSSQTADGSMMGTPYYMPPEQVRGAKHVGGAADVYALGVVTYECLVGRRPFEADALPALVIKIHEGEYVRPSAARPGLPKEIDAVIAKALAREPEKRFSTAGAFAAALRRAGEGVAATEWHPSSLPPPSREARALDLGTAPALSQATLPTPPAEPSRPARGALAVAALGAVVAIVGLAVFLSRGGPEDPAVRESPASHPTATAPPPPESTPVLAPVVGALVTPSAPDAPSASAAAPRPLPAPSSLPAKAAAPKPAASTSRARERGLAEENPF
jgi:eukaryotic-like serine/threonine-protein kinase